MNKKPIRPTILQDRIAIEEKPTGSSRKARVQSTNIERD